MARPSAIGTNFSSNSFRPTDRVFKDSANSVTSDPPLASLNFFLNSLDPELSFARPPSRSVVPFSIPRATSFNLSILAFISLRPAVYWLIPEFKLSPPWFSLLTAPVTGFICSGKVEKACAIWSKDDFNLAEPSSSLPAPSLKSDKPVEILVEPSFSLPDASTSLSEFFVNSLIPFSNSSIDPIFLPS